MLSRLGIIKVQPALILQVACTFLAATGNWAAAATEIKIAGATETSLNWVRKVQTEIETEAKVKLNFGRYQAKLAVANLAKGITDGFTGPDIGVILKEAIADKLVLDQGVDQFAKTLIGKSITYVALHPDNSLTELKPVQIGEILSGKIKNWAEIGGKAEKIVLIRNTDQVGLWARIEKRYIGGEKMRQAEEMVKDGAGQMRSLSKNPGGITFYSTAPAKIGDFAPKQLRTDMENEIFLWTKKETRPEVAKVVEFIKKKGRLDVLK